MTKQKLIAHWSVLWIFLLISVPKLCKVEAESGAMIMLDNQQDSPSNEKNKADSATNDDKSTNIGVGGGKIKSAVKLENHIKIAESHIEDQEKLGLDANSKVSRKDKASHLQNPQKHASDEWLLHFLLEQYSLSDNNVEEQVEILQNLENFSHKFENGRDLFKSTNALKDILLPALNSSHVEIRKAACGVFAVAAQNNAFVQNEAMEHGVIRVLIHILQFDQHVRPKSLYALSSLLRNFPEAQRKFVLEGGTAAVVKVTFLSETRKRALTFISDLLNERYYCLLEKKTKSNNDEQIRMPSQDLDYRDLVQTTEDPCDEVGLLQHSLRTNGWCDVLQDTVNNLSGFEDDDQILIVEAVWGSLSFCEDKIREFEAIFYSLLIKFQSGDAYDDSVVTTLRNILSKVDTLGHLSKTEL